MVNSITQKTAKLKNRMSKSRRSDLLFYCLMLVFPVLQFCIFYIGVNTNSILLSFQKIDLLSNSVTWTFDVIKDVFAELTSRSVLQMIWRSIWTNGLIMIISVPLGLLFAYYIYKKLPLANTFRVMLFLPSIISAIVMVTIYQFFVDRGIPAYWDFLFDKELGGLLSTPSTRYATLIFYNIWVCFGTSVLMYSNAMGGISPEMVEASRLDGATGIKEFWHVTLPMVYPTLTTFLITSVSGLFMGQLNLYSFYGNTAAPEVLNFGYFLYNETLKANRAGYPRLAAMGLMMTIIIVPLTLLTKWLMEKYGPSED